MNSKRWSSALFTIGDYGAGAVTGALTAAAVRWVVAPDTDLVLAMLVGIALGQVIHVLVGLLFAPALDLFHVLVPGSLIATYGGMIFAMRDAMQGLRGSLNRAAVIGAAFGAVVVAVVHFYDRALRMTNHASR